MRSKYKKRSPTASTTHALRASGYMTAVVEHWHHFAKKKIDLFGFADIIAARNTDGVQDIVLVQATSGTNHSARRKKILAEPKALEWIRAGGRVEVWSWRTLKAEGWMPRVEEILEGDFNG